MKTYVSSNGITMVSGNKLNWEKIHRTTSTGDPSYAYICSYHVGGLSEAWIINYHPDTKELNIVNMSEYSSGAFTFKVKNLDEAEFLALSFTEGMKQEVAPLYKKQ